MIRYVLLLALVGAACAEKARFDNYRVHSVLPETEHHVQFLRQLEEKHDAFLFWNDVRRVNASVLIMVPPHKSAHFQELTEFAGLKHEIFIRDVQKLIDEENDNAAARTGTFGWNAYYRLEVIYEWLESLKVKYPGVVDVVVGGTTYEKRKIKGVKVTYKESNPGVFIEAGIHAREWITPATVTYILNEILTNQDATFRKLVESFNWYVFPSFNPDGYEYTHTTYRMWRKTRSPSPDDDGCFGADPNRNWSHMFDKGGVSKNPCSDTYGGEKEFTEVETRTMSEFLTTIKDKINIYLGFHSFSQLLLIPYGFTDANKEENLVPNYDELMTIGNLAKISLAERYGTEYTVGNIVDVIYVASGSSMDWVRGVLDIPFTYTYELRDKGRYGFLLPASQIIPTSVETLDSVVTILEEVLKRIQDDTK